jgi:hypothetical protein
MGAGMADTIAALGREETVGRIKLFLGNMPNRK